MTEDRRAEDQPVKHIGAWLRSWWFLIILTLGGAGTLITLWFQVQYVIGVVNPEEMLVYKEKTAIQEVKREIRWCLGKMVLADDINIRELMECAD